MPTITLLHLNKLRSLAGALLAFALWTSVTSTAYALDASLYQRLGGLVGVTAIVGETIDTLAADPLTNHSLDRVEMRDLCSKIVEQICPTNCGGCKYSSDTMKQVHAGLKVTEAEFYITVQVLRNIFDRRAGKRDVVTN